MNYPELKIQDYLIKEKKKTSFKLRVRAEKFGDNFRDGKDLIFALVPGSPRQSRMELHMIGLTKSNKDCKLLLRNIQ